MHEKQKFLTFKPSIFLKSVPTRVTSLLIVMYTALRTVLSNYQKITE